MHRSRPDVGSSSTVKYTPGERTSWETTTRSAPLMMNVPLSVMMLQLVAEPVLPQWPRRFAVVAVIGADIATALVGGGDAAAAQVTNDLVIIVVAVGTANLWAQSGLRARDAAILACGLAAYDLVFTSVLPTTADLFSRLMGRPFAPMVISPTSAAGDTVALGLGDLLVLTLWPLLLRKAFGLRPALVGVSTDVVALAAVLLLPGPGIFPVMVVLGPLMLAQYALWHHLIGGEGRTREYLLDDAMVRPTTSLHTLAIGQQRSLPM